VPIAWTDVSGKPSTYPPSTHNHPISEVVNLQTTLDGKSPVGHTHAYSSLTGIPATFAPSAHTHPQSDVTNLVSDLALKAPLASPAFSGNPTAPTPTAGDNDTSIATTAFVTNAVTAAGGASPSNSNPIMDSVAAPGTSALYSRSDHVHPSDTSREPTIAAGTTSQYWKGNKTWATLDKAAVGLGNVDNTSDANKPVSTAQATADSLRVLKAGDVMTGSLALGYSSPTLGLNKPDDTNNSVVGYKNSLARWHLLLGSSQPESGSNVGSDFALGRCNDAGTIIDYPITVTRSNSGIALNGDTYVQKANATLNINASTGAPSLKYMIGGGEVSAVYDNAGGIVVASNGAHTQGMYITRGASAWTAISDQRLPEKVGATPLKMLDRIDQIQVYENTYDGRLTLFVIAQEMHKCLPHLVKVGSSDERHVPKGIDDPDAWGVTYDRAGVAALQLGKEVYETLLEKIADLTMRVEQLERIKDASG
jgi:hypothetical protein